MIDTFLIRFCIFTCCVLIVHSAAAQVIDVSQDYYLARVANSHESNAVREAMAMCSRGEFKSAIPVLKKYSGNGDLSARYVLARFHEVGAGVEKSTDDSQTLLRKNIDSGHLPSMVSLADKLQPTSPAESLHLYRMAAAQGDVLAALRLGNIYENGKLPGTRVNRRLALKYYQQSAAADVPLAHFKLGQMYAKGSGVSLNDLEANRLYRKAALSGVPAANTEMAKRYLEGKGLNPDPVAALGWLTRAAQIGNTEAMVILGQLYQAGEVVKQDLNMSGQLYSAATKANDLQGRYHLAVMYYNGVGTKPDIVRAFVLLHGAQNLTKAKELYIKIRKEMTPDQLRVAEEKLKNPANQ